MKRRDFFRKAGIGSATLVSLPALAHALTLPESARSPLDAGGGLGNTFSVLLSGLYKPVAKCPDLGLSVDVCNGSYSTTKIYPISGLPVGESDQFNRGNRRAISIAKRRTPSATFTWRLVACHLLPTTSRGAR